jgi:hypothetical protein
MANFVFLQVPDEVPPCARRDFGDLGAGFLDAALAEKRLSGFESFSDRVGRMRFRNGNQRDVGWQAAGASGGGRDLVVDG